jgi:hypothetical protein
LAYRQFPTAGVNGQLHGRLHCAPRRRRSTFQSLRQRRWLLGRLALYGITLAEVVGGGLGEWLFGRLGGRRPGRNGLEARFPDRLGVPPLHVGLRRGNTGGCASTIRKIRTAIARQWATAEQAQLPSDGDRCRRYAILQPRYEYQPDLKESEASPG